LIAGLHVPEIEGILLEEVSNVNVSPEQIAATCVKVGVTLELIVTSTFVRVLSQVPLLMLTQYDLLEVSVGEVKDVDVEIVDPPV
jgi:hypothetical protein